MWNIAMLLNEYKTKYKGEEVINVIIETINIHIYRLCWLRVEIFTLHSTKDATQQTFMGNPLHLFVQVPKKKAIKTEFKFVKFLTNTINYV